MNPFQNKTQLLPVIIQENNSLVVLMLGYMNEEAFIKTQNEGIVTFFSRSKNRLWTKGETSGNFLNVVDMHLDCDQDTLLIQVNSQGPTCHNGTTTCFNQPLSSTFLNELELIIKQRLTQPMKASYVSNLSLKGINKIAQKVGEEAIELVIEAKDDNMELFENEAADLLFHYLILLQAKGSSLNAIERMLKNRNK